MGDYQHLEVDDGEVCTDHEKNRVQRLKGMIDESKLEHGKFKSSRVVGKNKNTKLPGKLKWQVGGAPTHSRQNSGSLVKVLEAAAPPRPDIPLTQWTGLSYESC